MHFLIPQDQRKSASYDAIRGFYSCDFNATCSSLQPVQQKGVWVEPVQKGSGPQKTTTYFRFGGGAGRRTSPSSSKSSNTFISTGTEHAHEFTRITKGENKENTKQSKDFKKRNKKKKTKTYAVWGEGSAVSHFQVRISPNTAARRPSRGIYWSTFPHGKWSWRFVTRVLRSAAFWSSSLYPRHQKKSLY